MAESLDITGATTVQVVIREDGNVLWVNTEQGCVLRICRITGEVLLDDRREVNDVGSRHGPDREAAEEAGRGREAD
jgi:hypothetical protein